MRVGMSAFGPSRHFAVAQHFGRFRREADINWQTKPAGWVANDPDRTSACILRVAVVRPASAPSHGVRLRGRQSILLRLKDM
jgi:hypothetical protein